MSALLLVAGMAVGAFVGSCGGIVAVLSRADLSEGSMEPFGYLLGGMMLGAAAGAAVVAEVVS
jgi:hypothetical protein